MTSKKDMRRADFVIPYIEPDAESREGEMSSTLSSTMPMAAMVTRNRMIAWVAVVFAMQQWLSETPMSRKRNGTPAYFAVLMALMALVVSLMGFVLPPPLPKKSSSTGAPPPQAA